MLFCIAKDKISINAHEMSITLIQALNQKSTEKVKRIEGIINKIIHLKENQSKEINANEFRKTQAKEDRKSVV